MEAQIIDPPCNPNTAFTRSRRTRAVCLSARSEFIQAYFALLLLLFSPLPSRSPPLSLLPVSRQKTVLKARPLLGMLDRSFTAEEQAMAVRKLVNAAVSSATPYHALESFFSPSPEPGAVRPT